MEIGESAEPGDSGRTDEHWFFACYKEEVPEDGGVCIKYGDCQIALFYFARRNEWYATQNECPHRKQMALSRGLIGSAGDEPKVACPFHKNTFSLKSGINLNGNEQSLEVYPVRLDENKVYIKIK
ncbi:MAG TPA: nitrite reductase small subunit NirD [Saprospiraceae bacterium]|nr:nitrite reductase small subunit NirD [Saprospiraceae bacterium]HNT19199.1 nitrite reductase small subunit NirD [Saprospiraceae bacterium]